MKAWRVKDKNEFYSTIVFAENPGKARALALNTDCCMDSSFTDIEVARVKEADYLHKNRKEIDWDNPGDRLFLVKELGWHCGDVMVFECEQCVAKDFCSEY